MAEAMDFWYGRAFFYELVHVVFGGEPDESLLTVLASPDCQDTLDVLAEECAAVKPLADYVSAIPSDVAERAGETERCHVAYNRAIAGLGSRRTSHPWESAYTSYKQLLMQRETLEVREAYRAFGYLPEMYLKVPDDHISLECAFMAALAQRSITALETDNASAETSSGSVDFATLVEGQRAFLKNHLMKWADSYAADLHEDVPDSLYDRAATALASFITSDVGFLSSPLN